VPENIATLVAEGVELTAYYGQSMCSPARAALLSGKFVHKIGFSDKWGPKREVTASVLWPFERFWTGKAKRNRHRRAS
jgi:arylsulfatase A-like enzyme